eukprot:scpid69941/ scgid20263/ 
MSSEKLPSGYYDLLTDQGTEIEVRKVYCDMDHYGGGWTRIAYINPTQQGSCPGNMSLQNLQVKLCTRQASTGAACHGATFQSPIGPYSEVMGFVTGYRDKAMDTFFAGYSDNVPLNNWYVDGVSITHGSPMRHLWTYTAGFSDHGSVFHCPCSPRPGAQPPSFVGSHYYC